MRTHLLTTTAAAALIPATSAQASRIFQEQPCRRTNGSRPFGLPLPKRPRLRATAVLASAARTLAARIAIPVIVLNGVSGVAFAQNATWVGAISTDWNTPGNWNTNVVPTGTATFGPSTPTSITIAASTAVQALSFNAPGYTFSSPFTSLSITGSGIQASPTNAPSFSFASGGAEFTGSSTAGPAFINIRDLGPLNFRDTSNAGTATMTAGVAGSNDDNTGGFIHFFGNSTADHANITANVFSNIEFHDSE
jgi:hypothetical protein